jgi:transposase
MRRDRFDHKVDRMVDHNEPDLQGVEVITGVGRRRRWSDDFKAQVVAESLEPDMVISEVARRHGLKPQQLFSWRNQFRTHAPAPRAFAPVVVEPQQSDAAKRTISPARDSGTARDMIEIVIKGAVIRVPVTVDADTLASVLRAVKATT